MAFSFSKLSLAYQFSLIFLTLLVLTLIAGCLRLYFINKKTEALAAADAEKFAAMKEANAGKTQVYTEGELFGVRALESGFYGGVYQSRPVTPNASRPGSPVLGGPSSSKGGKAKAYKPLSPTSIITPATPLAHEFDSSVQRDRSRRGLSLVSNPPSRPEEGSSYPQLPNRSYSPGRSPSPSKNVYTPAKENPFDDPSGVRTHMPTNGYDDAPSSAGTYSAFPSDSPPRHSPNNLSNRPYSPEGRSVSPYNSPEPVTPIQWRPRVLAGGKRKSSPGLDDVDEDRACLDFMQDETGEYSTRLALSNTASEYGSGRVSRRKSSSVLPGDSS